MKIIVPVCVVLCVAAFLVPGAALLVMIAAIPFALIALTALLRGFLSWAGIWSRVGGFFALILAGAMFCCATAVAGEIPGLSSVTRRHEEVVSGIPAEFRNALQKASVYANSLHMSKKGIYEHLVSKDGGRFSSDAAIYATQYVQANWKQNALQTAKTYQDGIGLSPAAIAEQLLTERFTQDQVTYALESLT